MCISCEEKIAARVAKKTCTECKTEKEEADFAPEQWQRSDPHQFRRMCISCEEEIAARERKDNQIMKKTCATCKKDKRKQDFAVSAWIRSDTHQDRRICRACERKRDISNQITMKMCGKCCTAKREKDFAPDEWQRSDHNQDRRICKKCQKQQQKDISKDHPWKCSTCNRILTRTDYSNKQANKGTQKKCKTCTGM